MNKEIFNTPAFENVKLNIYDPKEWILKQKPDFWSDKDTWSEELYSLKEIPEFSFINLEKHFAPSEEKNLINQDYSYNKELDIWFVNGNYYSFVYTPYSYGYSCQKVFFHLNSWIKGYDSLTSHLQKFWNSTRKKQYKNYIKEKYSISGKIDNKKLQQYIMREKLSKNLENMLMNLHLLEQNKDLSKDDCKEFLFILENLQKEFKKYIRFY